ncbi:MAG: kelch repeat-containing protein [Saprospiraceae bacterium]|nr:kelch repeat-containing protein [Saprospiraceae bacterium]
MRIATVLLMYSLLLACHAQPVERQSYTTLEWTEGPAPQNDYQYNIALTAGDLVYVTGGNRQGSLEVFDPAAGTWMRLQDAPLPRYFAAGAVTGEALYLIGGLDTSQHYTASVYRYDIASDTWTRRQDLPTRACRLAAVAFDGKIFVFGGLVGADDRNFENSAAVHIYDPAGDEWISGASMPVARHAHAAVVVDHRILVVGGYHKGPLNTADVYDPVRNSWSARSPMPTARGFFGLVTLEGLVYAIAGRVPADRGPIEQYDPEQDAWFRMEPMPFVRQRFGIAVSGDKVFLIGGEGTSRSVLIGEFEKQ